MFLPNHTDPGPLTYGSILDILIRNRRSLFHIQKECPMSNKDLVCFSFSYTSWFIKKYCLCWSCSTHMLNALQLLIAQWLHQYNMTLMIKQSAYQSCGWRQAETMQGFMCVYITISVGVRNLCLRQIPWSVLLITQLIQEGSLWAVPDGTMHTRNTAFVPATKEHSVHEAKPEQVQRQTSKECAG